MKKFYFCFLLILFGILSAKTAFAYVQIDSKYSYIGTSNPPSFTVTPACGGFLSYCNPSPIYNTSTKTATAKGQCTSTSFQTKNTITVGTTPACVVTLWYSCYSTTSGTSTVRSLKAEPASILNSNGYTCKATCTSGLCPGSSTIESNVQTTPTKSVYSVTIQK